MSECLLGFSSIPFLLFFGHFRSYCFLLRFAIFVYIYIHIACLECARIKALCFILSAIALGTLLHHAKTSGSAIELLL